MLSTELIAIFDEMDALTRQQPGGSQQQMRMNYLLAKASAFRDEVRRENKSVRPSDVELRAWQKFFRDGIGGVIETREVPEGTGNPIQALTMTGNLGHFVPTEFFREFLPMTMKAHDPLFDPEVVTFLKTPHGRPIQCPVFSDVKEVAVVIGEGYQSPTTLNPAALSAVPLLAWTYRTPYWGVSMEAEQDLDQTFSTVELFKAFVGDRLARGVGKDLMTGNGLSKPTGLLTQLKNLGVATIIAVGSKDYTGGTETGANSLGPTDYNNLFYSIEPQYRNSPRCFWLMTDETLYALSKLISKQGLPVVTLVDGIHTIMGKPVKTSPSMDQIGANKYPVLFGDFKYWVTRQVIADGYIRRSTELPGFAENGAAALQAFARFDGTLLFKDSLQSSPFISANHSTPLRLLQNAGA